MEYGEATALENPLQIGEVLLGRYRVIERLEEGGTSVVYRAEDERLSRPVCIKVFHHLSERAGILRTTYEHFVQEAFALSKLTHPNTLRIYDFGHLQRDAGDGPPFQVCEFMDGGTLAELVTEAGPLAPQEAVEVITAIASALSEAHHVGIIHRDIKPKNILFGRIGKGRIAKLADFGIAKALAMQHEELAHQAGDTHVVAGARLLLFSGLWAAPEQLVADPVDTSSDIYSLAVVAVYALTGRCVFRNRAARPAYSERMEGPARIRVVCEEAGIGNEAIALLQQSCAMVPRDRPQDADEFGRAFAEAFAARRSSASRAVALPPLGAEIASAGDGPSLYAVPPDITTDTEEGLDTAPAAPSGSVPTGAGGPPRRLSPSPRAQQVGDRTAHFYIADDSSVDLRCAGGTTRVRITLMHLGGARLNVHVRGLNCFVKKVGGRPTGGTQLTGPGMVELIGKDQRTIAAFRLIYGNPAAGHHVFTVGDHSVAIGHEECPQVVALDFGPSAELFFVFQPGTKAKKDPLGQQTKKHRTMRPS